MRTAGSSAASPPEALSVLTSTMKLGWSASAVSVTCAFSPSQPLPRFWPARTPGSCGVRMRSVAGTVSSRTWTCPLSCTKRCAHTARSVTTAGTSRSAPASSRASWASSQ